ncbi:hypothetical protein BPOR_0488g00080 [Botrytis porri]|uniref:DUF7924 domain-containing protein n=1 Tax=Botrytis porri TaxID=87229 RepID=A0A4Z1KRH9_9HELO|nr:hypothetical protein BPOR_0488g00080 [Botrytis porri]
MTSTDRLASAQKRQRIATPILKSSPTPSQLQEGWSQDVSKTESQRQLRSSSAKENCPTPPKTRKRPRQPEVERDTDYRQIKRPRKPDWQPSPARQPTHKKLRRETLDPVHKNSTDLSRKRAWPYSRKAAVEPSIGEGETDPVLHWIKTHKWPNRYSEQSDDNISHLLAKQKSTTSLRRKRSESSSFVPPSVTPSSTTPSDQKPREVKSAPNQDARYETLLSTKGSFMDESDLGITKTSQHTYLNLLDAEQTVPTDSLFRDDIFKRTCRGITNRNETRIIRDISLLIVPSAETLAKYGTDSLNILIESVNEGWNNSDPLTSIRPQPDYSVGFRREAFTKEQLNKLTPYIGNFLNGDHSLFMATYYMYFPFLTCEVKCGSAALDVADRQNAHSMTLAVRGIAELFKYVGREMEVHREILAFSISHDHTSVRIYGHYPVIEKGKDITFYRHPIHKFDFTALNGREKWTTYKFTKNIYDLWMPSHFKRICSAIDAIPADLDFSVPALSSQSFGLSGNLERSHLSELTALEPQSREPSQQRNK